MASRFILLLCILIYVPLANGQFGNQMTMGGVNPMLMGGGFSPMMGGNSMMGNMCPFPFQAAPNGMNSQDAEDMVQKRMEAAKKRADDAAADLKTAQDKVTADEDAVRRRLDAEAGTSIVDFLEGNRDDRSVYGTCASLGSQWYGSPESVEPTAAPVVPAPAGPPVNTAPEGGGGGHEPPVPTASRHSSNQQISLDRMPAADGPVVTAPQGPPQGPPPGQPLVPRPQGPPPEGSPMDCQARRAKGIDVFCYHGLDYWHTWAHESGEVSAAACTGPSIPCIHVAGSEEAGSKCRKALRDLPDDYQDFKDAQRRYKEAHKAEQDLDDDDYKRLSGNTEAGFGNNENTQARDMMDLQLLNAMYRSGGFSNPGMGGWPNQFPYSGYNRMTSMPGMMGMNGNMYGGMPGGIGQGGFGCNNNSMFNPFMRNPFQNQFQGPTFPQQPFAPWQAGSPYSMSNLGGVGIPHPRVVPLGGVGGLGGNTLPIYGGSQFGLQNGISPLNWPGSPIGQAVPINSYGYGNIGGYGGAGGLGGAAPPLELPITGGASVLPAVNSTGFVGGGFGLPGSVPASNLISPTTSGPQTIEPVLKH